MIASLLSRQQFEILNRKALRYPLQIAEKDYFLAIVLQIISTSSLEETLIFKGGTAIYHCYLDQFRFSEDLDFSANRTNLAVEEVQLMFSEIEFLAIKTMFHSAATIKIEKLQYTGPLNHPNSIKVEIDFLQNVLLPPRMMRYKNIWGLDFNVRVMDEREICAEKIRAMSDRARYRDFYDLFLIRDAYNINIEEVISLIRKKEIRKPITKTNIWRNWGLVGTQKAKEMNQIHYSLNVDDLEIMKLIDSLPFDEIAH